MSRANVVSRQDSATSRGCGLHVPSTSRLHANWPSTSQPSVTRTDGRRIEETATFKQTRARFFFCSGERCLSPDSRTTAGVTSLWSSWMETQIVGGRSQTFQPAFFIFLETFQRRRTTWKKTRAEYLSEGDLWTRPHLCCSLTSSFFVTGRWKHSAGDDSRGEVLMKNCVWRSWRRRYLLNVRRHQEHLTSHLAFFYTFLGTWLRHSLSQTTVPIILISLCPYVYKGVMLPSCVSTWKRNGLKLSRR